MLPPEMIPEDAVAASSGLIVNRSGITEAAPEEVMISNLDSIQAGTRGWLWTPARKPEGSDGSPIAVYTKANVLWYAYTQKGGAIIKKSIADLSDYSKLAVSMDGNQLVFVDGMTGNALRRLIVNDKNQVECVLFGSPQPKTAPIVTRITAEVNRDEEYTGMPVGSILMYCYTVMNRYGEVSNPSPVGVVDTAQWHLKGNYDSGEYEYDAHNHGSIKNVSVVCHIPASSMPKTLFLYRTSAEYTESKVPVPTPQLVGVYPLSAATGESVTVSDVSFPASQTPDYENDPSPAADYVSIIGEQIFLGNTGKDSLFPFPVSEAYRITITNNNTSNYVNQWHQICLYDNNAEESLVNFPGNLSLMISANTRFIDDDRITPLLCRYTENGWYHHPETGGIGRHQVMYYIRIPIVPANSHKTIYLVRFESPVDGYGEKILYSRLPLMLRAGEIRLGMVRDERVLALYMDDDPTIFIEGADTGKAFNRANARDEKAPDLDIPDGSITNHIFHPQGILTKVWTPICAGVTIEDEDEEHPYVSLNNDNAEELLKYLDVSETETIISLLVHPTPTDEPGAEYPHLGDTLKEIYHVNVDDIDWYLVCTTPYHAIWIRRRKDDNVEYVSILYTKPTINYPSYDAGQINIPVVEAGDILVNLAVHSSYSAETKIVKTGARIEYYIINGVVSSWESSVDAEYRMTSPAKTIAAVPLHIGNRHSDANNFYGDHPIYISRFEFTAGREKGSWEDFRQRFAGLPIFDNEAFGAYDLREVAGNTYMVNKNVVIEKISDVNIMQPGRLRWSRGGSMPETNERMINEGISGMFPMRSLAPTEERNTLLIWNSHGDLMRISFSGDNTEIITDSYGVGVPSQDGIVGVDDGIAFVTKDTNRVYLYSRSGLRDISSNVLSGDPTRLFYLPTMNTLIANMGEHYGFYNIRYGSWSTLTYPIVILASSGASGDSFLLGKDIGGNKLSVYELSGERQNISLTTRQYSFAGVNRINIIGEARGEDRVVVRAILYGSKYAGGSAYTAYTRELEINKPFSIPGIRGSRGFQLAITGSLDSIKYIDIDTEE